MHYHMLKYNIAKTGWDFVGVLRDKVEATSLFVDGSIDFYLSCDLGGDKELECAINLYDTEIDKTKKERG